MTRPVAHWPGRMVSLPGGERVWVAETPAPVPSGNDAGHGAGHDAGTDADLVLCVHGMSGAATNWTDLMAELAPDFACAAVDLPGSGFSPPPRSPRGYSVSALARTVTRLIEVLGSAQGHGAGQRRRVHLIGNSMGGAVAIRAAARRPDLVSTLTLISPVLPDPRPRREIAHFPVIALPLLGERLIRYYVTRMPPEQRVSGVLATCFYDAAAMHPERVAQEIAELRRRDALGYDPRVLAMAARTLVGETLRPRPLSLWRAAARVRAPALVLFGSHDRLVDPRIAVRAARTFRDATVEVLPQTGHIAQMERPAVVAARFREMVEYTRMRGAARRPGSGPSGPQEPGNAGRRDPVDV